MRRRTTFQSIKQQDCTYVIEYLQSKENGAATVQELKYLCRRANMPGMAETVIGWLEQSGVVRYERELEAVYLVRPDRARTETFEEPTPAEPDSEPASEDGANG